MEATSHRIAGVRGADVPVAAVHRRPRSADAGITSIAVGAGVPVIAGIFIGGEQATRRTLAGIVRAGVGVVTEDERSTTQAADAGVSISTRVTIVTGRCVGQIHTANGRITGVVGADVGVVASHCDAAQTRAACAGLALGAGVAVVADGCIGREDATAKRLAGVVGADLSVVAGQATPAQADAALTGVTHGADVAVFAGKGVGRVATADPRLARVVGARVAVIAVRVQAGFAGPRCAGVRYGARVPVVAGKPIVGRGDAAPAGLPVADRDEAGCVRSLRCRAFDQGLRIDDALEGQPTGIADQGAVAEVPVLEGPAVFCYHAVARDRCTRADAVPALVSDCAGVPVIAVLCVGDVVAAADLGAGVIGAGI